MSLIFEFLKTHLGAYAANTTPPVVTSEPQLNLSGVLGPSNAHTGILNFGSISVDRIIFNIIFIAFSLAGLIAFGLIVYAGFLYITSGGDPQSIEKSRSIIMKAAIGLIIIILSFFITEFILALFKIGACNNLSVFNFSSLIQNNIFNDNYCPN